MITVNRDEWLLALHATDVECDPSALTVREIGQLLGIGRDAALKRAAALVATGKATRTQKRIVDAAGRPQIKPAYRLIDKPSKKVKR